jgi:hypothetical protein
MTFLTAYKVRTEKRSCTLKTEYHSSGTFLLRVKQYQPHQRCAVILTRGER